MFINKTNESSPNTGKYGPEITLYLDTFHTVWGIKYQMYNYNNDFF